jgi:multimeric flavodoxin WrbA
MKVLGILGSPRIGGNSDILLDEALAGARDLGAKVEKIALYKKKIAGCLDCGKCNETGVCVIKDDMLLIQKKILEADAVIHSVPVYFWSMTAQMKAYLDRWCAFFDGDWRIHKFYFPKMSKKKIGVITLCGDPDVSIGDPIIKSFKNTCDLSGLKWLGAVRASAFQKGEISKNSKAKKQAYQLGQKATRD